MTDNKQPWPKPDEPPLMMTTTQKNEMFKFINSLAHGVGLKNKLELAYKAGWLAKEKALLSEGIKGG